MGILAASGQPQRPVDLVYPLLDAAHSRWFYFSSACRPFGMVSLFPDNTIDGEWESGYRYDTDTIKDFSHIHEWQLSGVAVMPVSFEGDGPGALFTDYASVFSHDREIIHPGYHRVVLDRYHIRAELTASDRVGFHHYTYSDGAHHGVIISLGGHLGPSDMLKGGFRQIGDHEVRGFMVNGPTARRPKECPVFFSAVFDRPIKRIVLFQGGKTVDGKKEWEGEGGKIYIEFGEETKDLLMKVGLSFTGEEGAALNRRAEIPGWDFPAVTAAAEDQWNKALGRIKIEGGSLQQQRRFYTDLWHAIQGRRMISDADGHYSDCTGPVRKVRQIPLDEKGRPRFPMFNSDAFWGAQWTISTLWQLVYPEIAEQFCNSFLEYYRNGGLIPRGPSGGNYTFVMTGASSTPFFVSAWQKGIRGFDIGLAYEGLRKNHMPGGLMSKAGYEHSTAKGGGLEYYMSKGYVPYPLSDSIYGMHQDGAAMTLEYAWQDWCLAQLAKALGKKEDEQYFSVRSQNYRNLFDRRSGYIVPRDKDGRWKEPYDPLLYDNGFEEANGAQYTWFVPHDLPGLFDLMGGKDSAVQRLNRQFELTRPYRFCNEHPESSPRFVNDKRTWINYSNQPDMETAFIFNEAGAPALTQYWSRMVVDSAFSALSPYYGYNGDEDQGLMGSLSVLMKIGLFQMKGGCDSDPSYEIGSPLFDKVSIRLNPKYYKCPEFVISTLNNSPADLYIRSARINGKKLSGSRIRQSDINAGGRLVLEMGKTPSQ